MTPQVDVVIPVLNGGDALERTVRAVVGGDLRPTAIIVADNGSTDGAPERLTALPGVRVVYEPRQSSYAARNRGIAETTAPIVAFVDADCAPSASWLAEGVAALAQGGVDLVAGELRQRPGRTAWGRYDEVTYVNQQRNVESLQFGATGNLFVTRRALELTGGFDSSLQSGGDLDLGRRATALGCRVGYAAATVVEHEPQQTARGVLKKARRLGGGHGTVARHDPAFRRWALSPLRVVPNPTFLRRHWRQPSLVAIDVVVRLTEYAARLRGYFAAGAR